MIVRKGCELLVNYALVCVQVYIPVRGRRILENIMSPGLQNRTFQKSVQIFIHPELFKNLFSFSKDHLMCEWVYFHSTPALSFYTNGNGSLVVQPPLPSQCQSDRTPFTFLSVLTLSLWIAKAGRDYTEYEGEASTPDWNKLASIRQYLHIRRARLTVTTKNGGKILCSLQMKAVVIFPNENWNHSTIFFHIIVPKHNTEPTSERSFEVSSCSCCGAGNQTECKNNQTFTPPTLISVTFCAAADKVHYSEVWRLDTFGLWS